MLHGRWFNGQSSVAQPVRLTLLAGKGGPQLHLKPLGADAAIRRFSAQEVGWPERWRAGRTPACVIVDLRDHGSIEVTDVAAWQAAFEAAGGRASLAERMQTRCRVFAAVLLLAMAGLWAFYRWGTPWAATQLTRQVPLAWEAGFAARALRDLDASYLKPSELPPQRQAQLRERFDALANALASGLAPNLQRYPGYAPQFTLSFRSGLGANAFALPGGTVVLTDGLVEAAARQRLGDDALVGVLAHEIGHVVHRHTTRMVVEQGALNVGLGLALGDVSTMVSMGASLLTGLAYRRGHEVEADCFAAALMRQAQLPTAPMADLLLGMEARRHDGKPQREDEVGGPVARLLSSHPQTAERARMLKQGQLQGCPS